MTIITEAWLQEVAKSLQFPPLSPAVVNALLPTIELQIRRIVQQAHKHQRRSKSAKLKGIMAHLASLTC
ncbi:hypothetical protein EON65_10940 [archaeon]|nr:MAG: hypothetical protein EON65_10940 [archaeon]